MNDDNKLVNEIADQLLWWYEIGKISTIDADMVDEALDYLHPNGIDEYSFEQIDNLKFRVMMAL